MIDFNNEECTCDFLSKMKSAKAVESPWKYYIVDDFFCESCFSKILEELKNLVPDKTDFGHHEGREDYTAFRSYNHIQQYLNCVDYMYTLYPNHRSYDHLFCYPNLLQMKEGVNWPVHADIEEKTCTLVIYIDPEESIGTEIYSTQYERDHAIEWKPNRASFFCPETNKTWHAYHSPKATRTTLTFFATENKFKGYEQLYLKTPPTNTYDDAMYRYIAEEKCTKNFK